MPIEPTVSVRSGGASLLTVCTTVRQDDVRPHPSPGQFKSVRRSKRTAPLALALGGNGRSGFVGSTGEASPRHGEPKNPFPMPAELSCPVSSPAAARFVCAPLQPFPSSPSLWKSRNRLTPIHPARNRPRSTRSKTNSGLAASMRWTADRRKRLFWEPPALATTQSSSALPPAGQRTSPRRQREVVSVDAGTGAGKASLQSPKDRVANRFSRPFSSRLPSPR